MGDLHALGKCVDLKTLTLFECFFPDDFKISLIFKNLTKLENLNLCEMSLSRADVETISQSCQLLRSLNLSSVRGIGDKELRYLVEGCPSVRSLGLYNLSISDESVRMLLNNKPRIASIGLHCEEVSTERSLSLLKEINIPTILDSDDEELQSFALDTFRHMVSHTYLHHDSVLTDIFSHNSLLERLLKILADSADDPFCILEIFENVVPRLSDSLVVNAGVVPVLIRLFDSFGPCARFSTMLLFDELSMTPTHDRHLLTSGVLSLFRTELLQVRHQKFFGR
jgi:hypothetical protein